MTGSHEVRGSSPLSSTKSQKIKPLVSSGFFIFEPLLFFHTSLFNKGAGLYTRAPLSVNPASYSLINRITKI